MCVRTSVFDAWFGDALHLFDTESESAAETPSMMERTRLEVSGVVN